MTRSEAKRKLTSDSAHERLQAARFLARHSGLVDVVFLRSALERESVSYVRTSLILALTRVADSVPQATTDPVDEYEIPEELRLQIKQKVTNEIAGRILHEIASPVGLLAASAAREIPDFACSKTRINIENLQRVFEAIEQLAQATAIPKPQEFDLAHLIGEIVTASVGDEMVDVWLSGPSPFNITSDQALLSFSLSNGIRNAVEASATLQSDENHSIVVTWGATDIDYWVAVMDRGIGIIGPIEAAFGVGKTGKRGHRGFGLTIARQAIETLGGSCTLQPIAEGGAHFEIRWDK